MYEIDFYLLIFFFVLKNFISNCQAVTELDDKI